MLAGDPVERNQGKVDGDDVKPFVGEHVFGDDLEIEGDVLAAKRSQEDEDTSGGESDGTSGTLASTESDADVVPEKRRRRGAFHKARTQRNNNPSASIQVGPALQAELKKLQQLASRGSRAPKVEWDKVCKVAHEAISLLQPGSKTSDVAATFSSQATGKRGQHVVDIFATYENDKCKHVHHGASVEDDESTHEDLTESKTRTTTTLAS